MNGFDTRTGGTTEWLSTVQVSIPIQGTNDGFRFQLFSDIGWIWAENESMELSDLATAAGFGLRMPLAFPLSLDFAWMVDGPDDFPDNQVHFSIGGVHLLNPPFLSLHIKIRINYDSYSLCFSSDHR